MEILGVSVEIDIEHGDAASFFCNSGKRSTKLKRRRMGIESRTTIRKKKKKKRRKPESRDDEGSGC